MTIQEDPWPNAQLELWPLRRALQGDVIPKGARDIRIEFCLTANYVLYRLE